MAAAVRHIIRRVLASTWLCPSIPRSCFQDILIVPAMSHLGQNFHTRPLTQLLDSELPSFKWQSLEEAGAAECSCSFKRSCLDPSWCLFISLGKGYARHGRPFIWLMMSCRLTFTNWATKGQWGSVICLTTYIGPGPGIQTQAYLIPWRYVL